MKNGFSSIEIPPKSRCEPPPVPAGRGSTRKLRRPMVSAIFSKVTSHRWNSSQSLHGGRLTSRTPGSAVKPSRVQVGGRSTGRYPCQSTAQRSPMAAVMIRTSRSHCSVRRGGRKTVRPFFVVSKTSARLIASSGSRFRGRRSPAGPSVFNSSTRRMFHRSVIHFSSLKSSGNTQTGARGVCGSFACSQRSSSPSSRIS